KKFEKAFDPELDDPEAPVVNDGIFCCAAEKESRQVKNRNRQGREHEKPGDLLAFRVAHGRGKPSKQQNNPEHQSQCEQDLPAPAKIEIFPSLVSKPEPEVAEELIYAQEFPQKTPCHDGHQGPKQQVDSEHLPLGFRFPQGAGQKQTTAYVGACNPEKGQLQMPGAQNITRKYLIEIDSVKAPRFGPEVRGGPAHQDLGQEKKRHHEEILDGRFLALTSCAGQHVRMDGLGRPLPAQVVEFAESKQYQSRAHQEC